MSNKARYINPSQASRVAVALRAAGYSEASAQTCVGYAINVARHIDLHNEGRVHQIIDQTLDGSYVDAEGYAVES